MHVIDLESKEYNEHIEVRKKIEEQFKLKFQQPKAAPSNRIRKMPKPTSSSRRSGPKQRESAAMQDPVRYGKSLKKLIVKRLNDPRFKNQGLGESGGLLYCHPCLKLLSVKQDTVTKHVRNDTHVHHLEEFNKSGAVLINIINHCDTSN